MQVYGHIGVWNEIFDLLPITAVIAKALFCVHSGLSKNIDFVEQFDLVIRRAELPTDGPLCHVCWSDRDDVEEWIIMQRWVAFRWELGQKDPPAKRAPVHSALAPDGDGGIPMVLRQLPHHSVVGPELNGPGGNKVCVMKLGSGLDIDISVFDPHEDSLRRKPEDLARLSYFA
jgi:hypothetical protein